MRRAAGVFTSSLSSALLKPTGRNSVPVFTNARLYSTSVKPTASLLACRGLISAKTSTFAQTRGMAKGTAPSKLDQPRSELLQALRSRIEEVKGFLEDGEAGGLEQTGFKLETKEDGSVVLTRQVEGYKVSAVFNPSEAYIPDETQNEGEGGEEGEEGLREQGEEGAEGGEEGEGMDQSFGAEPFLAFEVHVESANGKRLFVDLDIDVYGQVHANGYRFSDTKDAVEVTEEIAQGLESFVSQLGIDTELIAYIWSHCRVYHDKAELTRLQELESFLKK